MAKTYYKYQEKDQSSHVNWADVGKQMSDMIGEDLKAREKLAGELDSQQQENIDYLKTAPQGDHEGQNEFVLDYAAKVSETMRIQNQLLKEGKLSLKDYNIQRANIMSGTKEAFSVAENWQETYATAKAQQDAGTLSEFSSAILMTNEKMGDYNSHSLYINPVDGQVSIGERVLSNPDMPYNADKNSPDYNPYTAQVVPNANSTQPISQLNNRNDQLLDKIDLDAVLAQGTDLLADTYQVLMAEGYNKIDDIRQHKDYFLAKTDAINSVVGDKNSFSAVSILTDFATEIPEGYTVWNEATGKVDFISFDQAGDDFDWTMDPDDPRLFDADGNRDQSMILIVPDPNQPNSGKLSPQLTEEQLEMARSIAGNQMDVQVDRSVTERTEFNPSQWEYMADKKSENEQALLTNLLDLFSGEEADMESTMTGLMDLPGNEWIKNITRNNESIIINKGMEDEQVIPLFTAGVIEGTEGGEAWTEEQFLKAVASKLGGFDNYAMATEVFNKLNPDREVGTLTTFDNQKDIFVTREQPPTKKEAIGVNSMMPLETSQGILAAFDELFEDYDVQNVTVGSAFNNLERFYTDEIKNWDKYVPAVTDLIEEIFLKGIQNNNVGLTEDNIRIMPNYEDRVIYLGLQDENGKVISGTTIALDLELKQFRGKSLQQELSNYMNKILKVPSQSQNTNNDEDVSDAAPPN